MERQKFIFVAVILTLVASWTYFVKEDFAPAQVVSVFTANPSSVRSGMSVDFIWQLQGAGGYTFVIPCVESVNVKPLGCGVNHSSTTKTSDYVSLTLVNYSGSSRSVKARLVPKDASGNDYYAGTREVAVLVDPMSDPITSFTPSSYATLPETPLTFSWASQEIAGVNMTMECKEYVRVTSPSYTAGYSLPCDRPIFSTNLAPAGSLILNFTNPTSSSIPVRFTLLPAITSQTYDGTHARYLMIDVSSDKVVDPEVRSFVGTTTDVLSGVQFGLSWSTVYTKGTNLKIACVEGVTASSSGVALPCDVFIFSQDHASTSKVTLGFSNLNQGRREVKVTLFPSAKVGEYDAVRAKSIFIGVLPLGHKSQVVTSPVPATAPAPTPPAPVSAAGSPQAKYVFSKTLFQGTRGTDVSALQEFLKKDSVLYPEGLVTGYFGPATGRAVQRFQTKYGIAAPGVAGYGVVGPKTRVKLNAVQ